MCVRVPTEENTKEKQKRTRHGGKKTSVQLYKNSQRARTGRSKDITMKCHELLCDEWINCVEKEMEFDTRCSSATVDPPRRSLDECMIEKCCDRCSSPGSIHLPRRWRTRCAGCWHAKEHCSSRWTYGECYDEAQAWI